MHATKVGNGILIPSGVFAAGYTSCRKQLIDNFICMFQQIEPMVQIDRTSTYISNIIFLKELIRKNVQHLQCCKYITS